MDLTAIRLRLTDYLNDDSTQRWSSSTRDAYINIAYKQFCNEENWPFRESIDTSINTVSGTRSYAAPAAMNMPLSIWLDEINSPNKLAAITRKEREMMNFSGNAKPQYYFQFASSIQLYPIPDQVYNLIIEYQSKITDLSSGTDVPIFDSDFHYLIPLLAASMLKRTSGGTDVTEGDNLYQQYLLGLASAKARLIPRNIDRPKGVVSVYDYGNYNGYLQSNY